MSNHWTLFETLNLVGMDLEQAREKLIAKGFRERITSMDGKAYIITHNFDLNRVNLKVVKGVVMEASLG